MHTILKHGHIKDGAQKNTEYTQSTYQAVMSKEEGSLGGIFPECIL